MLGQPTLVAPALPFGASGEHQEFAGTVSIGHDALHAVLVELIRSLSTWADRIVLVNGHGGNTPADTTATEWAAEHPATRIKFHNWWSAPKTWAKAVDIDPVASHASCHSTSPRAPVSRQPANDTPPRPSP